MIPAMLVLDIIPEFRLNIITLDTIPFSPLILLDVIPHSTLFHHFATYHVKTLDLIPIVVFSQLPRIPSFEVQSPEFRWV